MKKQLLLLGGLLLSAIGSYAQLTNCGLAIAKSGAGPVKTYTLTVPATVPAYSFNINPSTGVTTTGTGLVKTATFAYGGVYTLYLESPNYCTDSIWIQDTVQGPLNCAGVYSYLNRSGSGLTWNINQNVYGGNAPGYTSATLYNYGDGTSGTSNSHTYTSAGNYLITATTTLSHPSYPPCNKIDTVTIIATGGTSNFNCANAHAGFTYTNNGATYTFNNTSSYPATAGVSVAYQWSSNAGFSATGAGSKTYTFAQNGTYNIWLKATWTGNGMVLCRDSVMQTINVTSVPPPPNVITAYASWDSTVNAAGASLKMWLIKYDSSAQTLSAVDSALIPISANMAFAAHDFMNRPAGSYRVKAHMINQPSSWTTGFLPTYATNAAYWNNATVINHTGATSYASVWLQQGTPMTGPGFISGNILQGANKGAAVGDPMPHITVLLRNNANGLVAATETDANGMYSFANVPVGSYSIYPEEMNYATTPSAQIQITTANPRSTANDFWRETIAKTLHPMATAVQSVSLENTIRISPNPAREQLTLEFATAPQKGAVLQLYNLNGQRVKSYEITDAQSTQQLSLSGIAAGNYLLHIPTAEGKQITRITVQP